MTKKRRMKLIHEGDYIAQVEVEFIYTDEAWSPYLSLDDTRKLDDVRILMRQGDIELATQSACIYKLTPISIAA